MDVDASVCIALCRAARWLVIPELYQQAAGYLYALLAPTLEPDEGVEALVQVIESIYKSDRKQWEAVRGVFGKLCQQRVVRLLKHDGFDRCLKLHPDLAKAILEAYVSE